MFRSNGNTEREIDRWITSVKSQTISSLTRVSLTLTYGHHEILDKSLKLNSSEGGKKNPLR